MCLVNLYQSQIRFTDTLLSCNIPNNVEALADSKWTQAMQEEMVALRKEIHGLVGKGVFAIETKFVVSSWMATSHLWGEFGYMEKWKAKGSGFD